MFLFDDFNFDTKAQMYEYMEKCLYSLFENERRMLPDTANAAALIYSALPDVNWAGFYIAYGDELVLGPFQGGPACISIKFGKGVCGACAKDDQPKLVDDVLQFEGHIPCDSASRSELVIPIHKEGKVVAVLDIDSPILARFDKDDLTGLQNLCRVMEEKIDW